MANVGREGGSSLIGEPLSEQHLIAIDQGTRQLLDAVGLATDGLSLAISQIAMEEYLSYGKDDPSLSEEERRDLPDSYLMKKGQLMGSPLSFPILCAINYVAYRSALKRFVQAKGLFWSRRLDETSLTGGSLTNAVGW